MLHRVRESSTSLLLALALPRYPPIRSFWMASNKKTPTAANPKLSPKSPAAVKPKSSAPAPTLFAVDPATGPPFDPAVDPSAT